MESSILAQNERWRRVLSMQVEREGGQPLESGGRVSNTWIIWPLDGDSLVKVRIIPDNTRTTDVVSGKGATAPL